jgi:hypothetical protein
LGKPGGPGLFGDRSLNLPPYVQNIAHSLMTKRGMDRSKAIQVALGTVKNWASGQGDVRPEVRAAATAAVAAWEAAKAKAHATPNKGNNDVTLSQPMTVLRAVLDGSSVVDLAIAPEPLPQKTDKKPPVQKAKKNEHPEGKHKLPPGAVGWKHNWQPVDDQGRPVGPPQKDKSASEIADMAGHTEATKDAIRQAYKNKATADGKKAAVKAKSDSRRAVAAKKRAEAAAKRLAKQKAAVKKREAHKREMAAKKAAAAKARAEKAKTTEHRKLVAAAIKQALADKKAGRPLTPSQVRLLDRYDTQQAEQTDNLRNNVSLSQPMASEQITVPTGSSQDGARLTVNSLMTKYPKRYLAGAAIKTQKKRRNCRREGGQ